MIHQIITIKKSSFIFPQRVMQIFSLLYSKIPKTQRERKEKIRTRKKDTKSKCCSQTISLRKHNESCINCSLFPQNCHSKIDTIFVRFQDQKGCLCLVIVLNLKTLSRFKSLSTSVSIRTCQHSPFVKDKRTYDLEDFQSETCQKEE